MANTIQISNLLTLCLFLICFVSRNSLNSIVPSKPHDADVFSTILIPSELTCRSNDSAYYQIIILLLEGEYSLDHSLRILLKLNADKLLSSQNFNKIASKGNDCITFSFTFEIQIYHLSTTTEDLPSLNTIMEFPYFSEVHSTTTAKTP